MQFPATVTVVVNAAVPVHVTLFGPKTLKVMVPVGADPPERMAVSVIGLPVRTEPDTGAGGDTVGPKPVSTDASG